MARKIPRQRKEPQAAHDGPPEVTRRVTFRVYPTPAQAALLDEWARLHCELYNAGLQERRDAWHIRGESINYFHQQNQLPEIKVLRPDLLPLGAHALHATLRRVDLAFQHFFDRVKARKSGDLSRKVGYPRFKARQRFKGFTYPDHDNWKLVQGTPGKHGFLDIKHLGRLRIRGKARTWGRETTLTLTRSGDHWFASVTVACRPSRVCGTEALAFDWGLENFITLSTGEVVESPRLLKAAEAKLKKAQRDLSRKIGPDQRHPMVVPSKGWLRQKAALRRLHQEVVNRRQDFHHKESAKLVRRAALLVTEGLNILGMTASAKGTVEQPGKKVKQKAGLNRSILDSAPGGYLSKVAYKAEEAGCVRDGIEPRKWKPSQTCPGCGKQMKKPLKERLHLCPECGLRASRDHASALVMRNIALTGRAWEPGLRGANLLPPGRSAA